MSEREQIVAWLRQDAANCLSRVANGSNNPVGNIARANILEDAAEAIERGDHKAGDTLYAEAVRDLACMDHVSPAIAGVLRDCASTIATQQEAIDELVAGLRVADEAIAEMFRYYDGGEARGSYDGKPERKQLRAAGGKTRALLSKHGERT